MRSEIDLMFSDYRQSFKLRWGRIINAGFDKIISELDILGEKYNCKQEVREDKY